MCFWLGFGCFLRIHASSLRFLLQNSDFLDEKFTKPSSQCPKKGPEELDYQLQFLSRFGWTGTTCWQRELVCRNPVLNWRFWHSHYHTAWVGPQLGPKSPAWHAPVTWKVGMVDQDSSSGSDLPCSSEDRVLLGTRLPSPLEIKTQRGSPKSQKKKVI